MKKNENGQAAVLTSSDGLAWQLAIMGIWTAIGCLLPRALIYGRLSPFGVSLAAVAGGPTAVPVCLALFAGYILADGLSFPLRYLIAVMAAAGFRWTLSGFPKVTEHPLFAPLAAFGALMTSGLALAGFSYIDLYGIFLLIAESLLSAAFAYLCAVTFSIKSLRETGLHSGQKFALICVVSTVLLALSSVQINGISPGRILASTVVLLSARVAREKGGGTAGALMGSLLALSGEHSVYLSVSYALGGMAAGWVAKRNRSAAVTAFFTAGLVVVLATPDKVDAVIQVYESAAASLLFLIIPFRWEEKLRSLFIPPAFSEAVNGMCSTVASRLGQTSLAMRDVAGTVDAVSQKLAGIGAPDIGTMYRRTTDDLCKRCRLQQHCWTADFQDTMDSFNHMTPILRNKGRIHIKDVEGKLARDCIKISEIVPRINAGYREHLVREGAFRRLSDLRGIISEQFSGMADVLADLGKTVANEKQTDEEMAARVTELCLHYGLLQVRTVCEVEGSQRITVHITALDHKAEWDEFAFLKDLKFLYGKAFRLTQVIRLEENKIQMRLDQIPKFRIQTEKIQISCHGEKYCGDAIECFEQEDGRYVAILSDGMGNGGRAAVDGAMAAGLTCKLMQSGLSADSVLRLVNSALMAKSGDESLATLDVAQIDPYTGRVLCCKAGAAASFLKSAYGVCRIEKSSLPLGILKEIVFEQSCFSMNAGDVLFVVSDGAVNSDASWLEEKLGIFDPKKEDLYTFVLSLARAARQSQKRNYEDDVSVIAIQLLQNE